jgi:hypothetical protein
VRKAARSLAAVLPACLLVALLYVSPAAAPVPRLVRPMPAAALSAMWNAYGDAGGHWTGGDGTVSVPLPDGRIAWLFSDSFLGTVNADHSRPAGTPAINNCLVVQDGTTLGPTLYGGTPDSPAALVAPGLGGAFYWVADATVEGDALSVLYGKYVGTAAGPPLGFALQGTALATFRLPGLTLSSVRDLPVSALIGWGSAVLEDGGFTYIYGNEFAGGAKFVHLARVAAGHLGGPWRFWTGGGWSGREADSARIIGGIGEGMSVTRVGDRYVLVTQRNDEIFSSRVVAYTAASPTGPFTGPVPLFDAPEARDRSRFIYAARVHPELSAPGRLLISYDVNAWNGGDLFRDARVYRPRFAEVRWPPAR